jgi:hypothetical protein
MRKITLKKTSGISLWMVFNKRILWGVLLLVPLKELFALMEKTQVFYLVMLTV